jgi:hypothetical protein
MSRLTELNAEDAATKEFRMGRVRVLWGHMDALHLSEQAVLAELRKEGVRGFRHVSELPLERIDDLIGQCEKARGKR